VSDAVDTKQAPELLSLAEAALFLRINPRTLEVWCRGPQPRVPVIRLGRRILFHRRELERWMEACTVHPSGKSGT
jgi:predicted DNA-binding transcriptional regulator AlpA